MNAPTPSTAPLPGGSNEPAADGPLPSDDAFASEDSVSHVLLRLGADPECTAAARRSFDALAAALCLVDQLPDVGAQLFPGIVNETLGDGAEQCIDGGDPLVVVSGRLATGRASELTILLKPSELYLELVAAVAADLQLDVIQVHGWPILSVDGAISTVSEAAGVSIPGSGAVSSSEASGAAQ